MKGGVEVPTFSKRTKIVIGFLVLSMLLVSGAALAYGQGAGSGAKLKQAFMGRLRAGKGVYYSLKEMVTGGVIDQTTADKLEAFFEQKRAAFRQQKTQSNTGGQPFDLLSQAVSEGVITQAQADAIRDYQQKAREKAREEQQSKRNEYIKQALAALVKDSVINQEQADKISSYLKSQQEARQAEMEKIKAMTPEERQAYMQAEREKREAEREKIRNMTAEERQKYMQQMMQNRRSPLSKLVEDGTLTQDQASAVEKALFGCVPGNGSGMGRGPKGAGPGHRGPWNSQTRNSQQS